MADLTTKYLGLELSNPIVAGASPLSEKLDSLRRLEDAGAAAVVLVSLFEEQLSAESHLLDQALYEGADSHHEAESYFPDLHTYKLGPDGYLEHLRRAKEALDIPVIASLNGVTTSGWVRFARELAEAGADALELNVYFMPTRIDLTGHDVVKAYIELVREVKEAVDVPLAVKMSHFFTAPANVGKQLADAGADGLVLFNRFYQPDFDLEELEVVPRLTLSNPYEILLRLHWVALMCGRVEADLAVTGGVHDATGVIKSMMAGARVTQMVSALLQRGPHRISEVLHDVERWMEEREYESIQQMQGSMSYKNVPHPAAFERANYVKVLRSYPVYMP